MTLDPITLSNLPSNQPPAQNESQSWQTQLANVVTDAFELAVQLRLPEHYIQAALQGGRNFPIRVPQAFINRIKKGDINDPLLRQIWPLSDESVPPPEGFVMDPLGEASSNKAPGIVHKYHGRVLLITNGSCAVNCRYCFRRHFPYGENALSSRQWIESMDYITKRSEINEVILSGGDPLSNNDSRLFSLVSAIESIPHVTRLRIHTRLPIVIPARITTQLIQRLTSSRLNVVIVVHVNHANEIDEEVADSLKKLHQAGIHVLNQSVLLKDVNNDVECLVNLSERLFSCNVLPYYLHLLDPVIGSHHFDVKQAVAQNLMALLQARLPGFLVPKLVKEIDGRPSKTLIDTPIAPT